MTIEVTAPTLSDVSSPSVISTSSASRSNYADNTSTLNSALSNITPPKTDTTPTGNAPTGSNITINAGGGGATDGNGNQLDSTGKVVGASNPKDNPNYDPSKDTSSSAYVDPDTGVRGAKTSDNGSLDPVVKKQFDDAGEQLDQGITAAQNTLAAVSATLNNDPAAQAAVAQISNQYNGLIQAMIAHNKIVLGGYSVGAARTGALQYANDMTTDFMSKEMEYANQRVQKLIDLESAAIMKSNAAYKAGDVKAFSVATTALKAAQTEKINMIGKLGTATSKALSDFQSKVKLAQATAKNNVTLDITKSKSLAASMAKQLKDAGITDPAQIKEYVNAVAQNQGITNPDVLGSALVTAQQTLNKATTAAGKKGKNTFNTTDGISQVTPRMEGAKGSDGYIDPAKWIATRVWWQGQGGTASSFNSNFKQYLNPASYAQAGFKAPTTPVTATPPL